MQLLTKIENNADLQIWYVGMQGYESVLKGSEDGTDCALESDPYDFPQL
jgi:hypothetical protein